jgi:DNA-binding HxlR family transcriptional regulator
MPETNYNQVISEIKTLNLSDQLRLLEEMAMLIRKKASGTQPRSILELKGKGKDIWNGLNVQKYIDKERSSWNG